MPRAEIARKARKRKQLNFVPSSKGGGKSIMTTLRNIGDPLVMRNIGDKS
jgi:hypothetical protein